MIITFKPFVKNTSAEHSSSLLTSIPYLILSLLSMFKLESITP